MRRFLPTREQIRQNRWLAWLGPHLHHARLWRWSRHGVALGVALGLFFGLIVLVAQIPLSAGAAVALRANLPAAVASTLVTNPLTFGPIYYAAYRLGVVVTGESAIAAPHLEPSASSEESSLLQRIQALGWPLIVGLAIMATLCGLFAYLLISLGWRFWIWHKRRRAQAAG